MIGKGDQGRPFRGGELSAKTKGWSEPDKIKAGGRVPVGTGEVRNLLGTGNSQGDWIERRASCV